MEGMLWKAACSIRGEKDAPKFKDYLLPLLFLKRLSDVKEGGRSLLDNSMILFGCGIGDGNRHNHNDLPVLLAGSAGGGITPGRHLKYDRNTPLCNLYVSMLDRMGVKVDRFGDSTGPLANLIA